MIKALNVNLTSQKSTKKRRIRQFEINLDWVYFIEKIGFLCLKTRCCTIHWLAFHVFPWGNNRTVVTNRTHSLIYDYSYVSFLITRILLISAVDPLHRRRTETPTAGEWANPRFCSVGLSEVCPAQVILPEELKREDESRVI